MNFIKSPEASLASYFDELLVEEQDGELALERKTERPALNLVPQAVVESVAEAVPEVALESVDKQRLERLLLSAQSQLVRADSQPPMPQVSQDNALVVGESRALSVDHSEDASRLFAPQPVADIPPLPEQLTEAPAQALPVAWCENGRPEWAQARFDVLLFDVAGLQLAVPLVALGQIQPLTDELTPLFGQAPWFMGLQPSSQGQIRTINTALFVMPERYDAAFIKTAKYVVSIDGVPWGLAVDKVNQPITLEPEDVRWRTDRSKRSWLAGTVKQHMCALLDVAQMGQLLQQADKNFAAAGIH